MSALRALAIGAGLLLARGSVWATETVAARPPSPPAHADRAVACPEIGEATAGPFPGGTGPADFATIPEACSGRDLSLRLRGALLVAADMPDYYGSLAAAATIRARHPVGRQGWVSIGFDAINYRYVNNAGLASDGGSVGPLSAGYHRGVLGTDRLAVSVYGRILLPVDTAREHSLGTGVELGAAARGRLRPRLILEGGVAAAAPAEITSGRVHARLEPLALAELHFRLRPGLGVFGGAAIRARGTPSPDLLGLGPRLGVRVASQGGLFGGLLVEVPIAGADRTDLVAGLYLGYGR